MKFVHWKSVRCNMQMSWLTTIATLLAQSRVFAAVVSVSGRAWIPSRCFSPLDWKPRPHPDDVAEVLGLGFGAWVKHSPPKRLRNAPAVAASGKQNRI